MKLNSLENTTRPHKGRKRVGRGTGSGIGRTCTRGIKGAGSRSGWKKRERYEGGQLPLYRKLPVRGFTRGRFLKRLDCINLSQIEQLFNDGEVVSEETLREKGLIKGASFGVKILGNGELTKKVRFEVQAFSGPAEEKLKKAGISYELV